MPQDPNHPILIEPTGQRWRAEFQGRAIADSGNAMVLREADMAPVIYFPRADVEIGYLGRTSRHSTCPWKGEASYYTLTFDGQVAENVAWSYEAPKEVAGPIAEFIAFYPDRVDVHPVDDARVNPHHRPDPSDIQRAYAEHRSVDEVVQHTDAGDGTSQSERWSPDLQPPAPEGGVR